MSPRFQMYWLNGFEFDTPAQIIRFDEEFINESRR